MLILDQVELEINYSLDTSLSSQVVRPSSAEGDGADINQMALPADLLYYYTDGAVVRVSPTTLGCSPTPPVMINLPDSYHEDASPPLTYNAVPEESPEMFFTEEGSISNDSSGLEVFSPHDCCIVNEVTSKAPFSDLHVYDVLATTNLSDGECSSVNDVTLEARISSTDQQ